MASVALSLDPHNPLCTLPMYFLWAMLTVVPMRSEITYEVCRPYVDPFS